MSTIKFRMAAKTDMGLVRTNNEDNFQVASDLSSEQMQWVNNECYSLGEKGALLVVADGMGGMNAGEVASALAIDTIREYFATEKLTSEITRSRFSIEKYMKDSILAADTNIKKKAENNPESHGMGTTIVLGWILDGKLYVSWCGDSRAYVYNPVSGLHQITKDHSYVQSLVDKGTISEEDAFDYPDRNIITRSLSDGSPKANPESLLKPYELCNNDIVLLCTDGLCGMIRDNEIEKVIRDNEHDMGVLVDKLIEAACNAEGSDNITICICQILLGGKESTPIVFEPYERKLKETDLRIEGKSDNYNSSILKKNKILYSLVVFLLFVIAGLGVYCIKSKHNPTPIPPVSMDTTVVKDVKKDTSNILLHTKAHSLNKAETTTINKSKKAKDKIIKETVSSGQKNEYPELTEQGSTSEASVASTKRETITYKVKSKDTFAKLSRLYMVSVDEIKKANPGKDTLKVGETILIPIAKKK